MKKITVPQQAIVFGSERIASIWALRNKIDRKEVVLATNPVDVAKLKDAPVAIVRVSEEEWKPTTFPDENRVRQTEELIKTHGKKKGEVVEGELK